MRNLEPTTCLIRIIQICIFSHVVHWMSCVSSLVASRSHSLLMTVSRSGSPRRSTCPFCPCVVFCFLDSAPDSVFLFVCFCMWRMCFRKSGFRASSDWEVFPRWRQPHLSHISHRQAAADYLRQRTLYLIVWLSFSRCWIVEFTQCVFLH